MSSKFLPVFAEENAELQKQIGCMTGIFQMFDRQHLLAGRRRLSGHNNHRRPPSGQPLISKGRHGAERSGSSPHIVLEKNLSKSSHENQRISFESSRTSFSSSSCSSSFSSLECNKSTQQEPPSFDQKLFPERSSMNFPNLKSSNIDIMPNCHEPRNKPLKASALPGQHSLDFRDVVVDSINKDACILSVKTSTKEKVKRHRLKHRDSPRPMPLSKSMDGSYIIGIDGQSKMPVDLNESLRVLVKLKEAPWNSSEARVPPRTPQEARDGSFYPVAKETPRFSYDGREISRTSLDSRENSRSGSKLKELPRLSLDSRSSTFDTKPNEFLKESDSSSIDQRLPPALKLQQESGSHNRLPCVVAKLMGLEAMPMWSLASQETVDVTKNNTNKYVDAINGQKNSIVILNSAKSAQTSKQVQQPHSPKISLKDRVTPRLKNQDPVMKPVSNSRIPIETAPWRQEDRVRATPKVVLRYWETHSKQQNESAYSEIEKKLKDLKCQHSNKDHRDLKQIIDTMQSKGLLATKQGQHQHSRISAQKRDTDQIPTEVDEVLIHNPIIVTENANPRGSQTPIVITKQVKSIKKLGVSASSVTPLEDLAGLPRLNINDSSVKKNSSHGNRMAREQISKTSAMEPTSNSSLSTTNKRSNNRAEDSNRQRAGLRMIQGSARPPETLKENSCSSVKSTSSVSPRLQQRKLEPEKKSRPPLPCGSNTPTRQPANRHPSDLVSPRNKLRRKQSQAQENNDQLSEPSNLSQQSDEISVRSDSSISLASQVDVEATSSDRSAEKRNAFYQQSSQRISGSAVNYAGSVVNKKESFLYSNGDTSTIDLATVALEQPSPISVLDASFDQDDLPPSPARKHSNTFKDNKSQTSDNHYSLTDMDDTRPSWMSSEINQKKLQKIENLVKKLKQLSSTDDETTATDHIASLCETQDPDHRYVSEILLASGLLMKDLSPEPMGTMPIQLHPSGHPINPDLFLVLEQTKTGWLPKPKASYDNKTKSDPKKLHRKLLFDAVNEILLQKLDLTSHALLSDSLRKSTGKFPSGQRLLKELCSKIDKLQANSLMGIITDENNSISGEEVLQQLEGWEDFGREAPGMVLEIERLIFKDLIDEVVRGESASGFKVKASAPRQRQLPVK